MMAKEARGGQLFFGPAYIGLTESVSSSLMLPVLACIRSNKSIHVLVTFRSAVTT
jgi:hypothetical protein